MKHVRFGDVLAGNVGFVVHGCNSAGVMGSGIAKQVKEEHPGCFDAYRQHLASLHAARNNPLGTNCLYEVRPDFIIVNAITQDSFGRETGKRYVDYRAVQSCFENVAYLVSQSAFKSVHYPQIGAGLGGGDWSIISDIIDCAFAPFPEVNHYLWIYQS
jgi:O-acetyl-ADP-ribose deacetylase (regulator of RNase III)